MIAEDYVSFETAKLLKEKGFEGVVNAYYHIWDNGNRVCSVQEFSHSEAPHLYIPAPHLSIAMKWLREIHKLFISIQLHIDGSYVWYIYKLDGTPKGCDRNPHNYSYEEAAEAVIKHCLENLI